MFGDKIVFATDAIRCLRGADGCLVATKWPQYKDLTPRVFERNMRRPLIVDGRRIYAPEKFVGMVEYVAIGTGRGS
jgi:UDPglucose 6-dehydrogenase